MVLLHYGCTAGGKIIVQFLGNLVLKRKFVAKFAKLYNAFRSKSKATKKNNLNKYF